LNSPDYKKVLIAPLDWGLGHAARCMPVIDQLLSNGHAVHLAGNGASLLFLKDKYPQLPAHELPGYNIRYPVGKNASVQILLQSPRMFRTIQQEHRFVEKIVADHHIDSIISDNRYGVWNKKCKNVIICHQVAIQSPDGFAWLNPLFLRAHFRMMKNFDVLWIPDEPGDINLSGKLSHGFRIPMPHIYIGTLSRFAGLKKQTAAATGKKYRIVALLSGNEPQRTFFERQLIPELKKQDDTCLLIQGVTEKKSWQTDGNLDIATFLQANEMISILQEAETIICRSGYSTLMDLAALGKKAILVPTPGQTEQEYLANELDRKQIAVRADQHSFDLDRALKSLESIKGFSLLESDRTVLQQAMEKCL
jgi:UDP:flavonoid glycosyltransferase YjiC (YdhE family)